MRKTRKRRQVEITPRTSCGHQATIDALTGELNAQPCMAEITEGEATPGHHCMVPRGVHGIMLHEFVGGEAAYRAISKLNANGRKLVKLYAATRAAVDPKCEWCPHVYTQHEAAGADHEQPCRACKCDGFAREDATQEFDALFKLLASIAESGAPPVAPAPAD